MKRLYKKIIVFILVLFMVFGGVVEAEASGAEGVVQVVGGSIAAGGIAAGIAAVAPPALIIIGLVMVAQGIDVALTEASQAEGMTKGEFIQSKFEDFCDYTKKDFERTCNTIVSGAKILADGTIWLAGEAGNAISQFINNLVANNEIGELTTSGETITVNGVPCPVLNEGEGLQYGIDNGITYTLINNEANPIVIFCTNDFQDTPQIYVAKSTSGRFNFKKISNVTSTDNSLPQHFYYQGQYRDVYYTRVGNLGSYAGVYVPVVGTLNEALISLIDGFDVQEGGANEDSFVGDVANIDTTILNPSSGNDIVIDTGLDLQGISSRYGDIGVISVDNYLDTLRDAINGVTDLTIAIQNVATGVIDNVDVGVYNPTDVAVTNESESDSENQVATPVIDVNSFPTGSEAQEALEGLKFDLTNIFPFCIPFDVVKIIEKFDVTPVAPHVQVSIPLPGLGQEFELDIDLSGFNTVATVFRSMELVAFVVGLAIITRNLIRG